MNGSSVISPLMTIWTSLGTSVRLFQPPKAVPFQHRPVTNWKGRVPISFPAAATPMMQDSPHPRCATYKKRIHCEQNQWDLPTKSDGHFPHFSADDSGYTIHPSLLTIVQEVRTSSALLMTLTFPVQSKV